MSVLTAWSDRAACRSEDPDLFFTDDDLGGWVGRALCAEVDGELWFPETGGSSASAKSICVRCEVREPCLAYALEHNEKGIWGGLSERERSRLKAGTRSSAEPFPLCDNGHPRTEENTRNRRDGRIECTDCERDRRARAKIRRAA
jgi:WhiB family redox-sensing transcriptional regulator